MEKNERYELLGQLSKFYVDKVEPNIDVFNKAILISNVALIGCWAIVIGMLFIFFFGGIIHTFAQLSDLFIIKNICPFILFIFFIFMVLFLGVVMPKLEMMDKENDIHVFGYGVRSVHLPVSADNEIKKRLMSDFLKIFGDFNWRQYMPRNFLQDYSFISRLKILNNFYLLFDDCIEGSYKGVNIGIKELNSSFFQRRTGIVMVLLFMIGVMIGFPISCLIFLLVLLICSLAVKFGFFFALCLVVVIYIILLSLGLKFGRTIFYNKCFRGVVVTIDMNKNFEGQTIVLEKNNFSEKLTAKMNGYDIVKLEDINFEKQYDVYSKNQVEARYILTTAFIDRLSNLKQKYKAKYVRVAFKDKKIVIAIHTGHDMFKMADMLSLTTGKETFVQLFEEIVSVLDLIDVLKLNNNLGL